MTNPLQSDGFRNLALLLARVAMGTYFILAGYSKFVKGFTQWATEQVTKVPSFLPTPIGKGYLLALPFVELLAGVALVVGFYTRTSATLIALMLVSFMIAVTGIGTSNPPQIDKNMVFLGMALLLMSSGGGQIAVDASMGGGGGGESGKGKKK